MEFQAMCKFLASNSAVNTLILWKISRGMRNRTDWALLTEGLRVQLISVTEGPIDSEQAQILGTLFVEFGRYQAIQIGEQASANMQAWAERGVYPSRSKTGYRNRLRENPKERGLGHEIDHEQASKIVKLFERYATGLYGIRDIFKHARKIDLETSRGNIVSSRNTINQILKDPFYVGDFYWKGKLYKGNHEPIISRQLFNRVQAVMRDQCNNHTKGKLEFFLKGLLQCAYCSTLLTAYNKSKKNKRDGRIHRWVYYACHKKAVSLCRKTHQEKNILNKLSFVFVPLRLSGRELAFIEQDCNLWFTERRG